jgi:hypothetical protein
VNSQTITSRVSNICNEGELKKSATCSKMKQFQIEGKRHITRNVKFYNLDMIISIGYRINSKTAKKTSAREISAGAHVANWLT